MSNCKVISISNQKGGTGKTCSACNLGIGLVRKGFKVLAIDADAQGSLTVSLGYRNQDELDVTLATVLEMIINDEVNQKRLIRLMQTFLKEKLSCKILLIT